MPFASVKVFSSTFDAIHPATMSRLLKSSTRRGALFFQIYGQSEVGPAVGRAYFRPFAHKANGRCVGWAMPRAPPASASSPSTATAPPGATPAASRSPGRAWPRPTTASRTATTATAPASGGDR